MFFLFSPENLIDVGVCRPESFPQPGLFDRHSFVSLRSSDKFYCTGTLTTALQRVPSLRCALRFNLWSHVRYGSIFSSGLIIGPHTCVHNTPIDQICGFLFIFFFKTNSAIFCWISIREGECLPRALVGCLLRGGGGGPRRHVSVRRAAGGAGPALHRPRVDQLRRGPPPPFPPPSALGFHFPPAYLVLTRRVWCRYF